MRRALLLMSWGSEDEKINVAVKIDTARRRMIIPRERKSWLPGISTKRVTHSM